MKHTDILVINPGSTTTKIAVFRDMKVLFEETITHDPANLKRWEIYSGRWTSERSS